MDMWKPKALSALTQWFPGLLDDSALIYNKVEATGRWPSAMLLAYTSLMPKDASRVEPKATDCWPITVLSGLYRLWSISQNLEPKARTIIILYQLFAGCVGAKGLGFHQRSYS